MPIINIIGIVGLCLILWMYLPDAIHQIRHQPSTRLKSTDLIIKITACTAGSIYGIGNSVPLLVVLCLCVIIINALLLLKK